jgi:hypothetical protein
MIPQPPAVEPLTPKPLVPEPAVSLRWKRVERVPPKPAIGRRLHWQLRVKAVVRDRTLSPMPLARRRASMAVASKSSPRPLWTRLSLRTPAPLDVVPAVSTPTGIPGLAHLPVYRAASKQGAPVAQGRGMLAPALLPRRARAASPRTLRLPAPAHEQALPWQRSGPAVQNRAPLTSLRQRAVPAASKQPVRMPTKLAVPEPVALMPSDTTVALWTAGRVLSVMRESSAQPAQSSALPVQSCVPRYPEYVRPAFPWQAGLRSRTRRRDLG